MFLSDVARPVAFGIMAGAVVMCIDTATYPWRWRRRIKKLGFSEWVQLSFAEEEIEFRSPLGKEAISYRTFIGCVGTPLGIFLRMTPDSSLFVPNNSIEPPERVEKLLAHLQRKIPAIS
ncbi:YcxB family protein [Aeoliella sp. SH292]|uniref:YcxB family protein n=1 Tax=Aeoliella sp. SH292 TaxID=3454464 RepID=UPI003F97955B